MKGWNAKWFYIRKAELSLSADIHHLAVPSANWSARPISSEMTQVDELLQILGQMHNNLDEVGVAINFVIHWIQLSKERFHPSYEYTGDEDTTREAPEKINKDDAYDHLLELFSSNTKLSNIGQQRAYNIMNPPPLLRIYHV